MVYVTDCCRCVRGFESRRGRIFFFFPLFFFTMIYLLTQSLTVPYPPLCQCKMMNLLPVCCLYGYCWCWTCLLWFITLFSPWCFSSHLTNNWINLRILSISVSLSLSLSLSLWLLIVTRFISHSERQGRQNTHKDNWNTNILSAVGITGMMGFKNLKKKKIIIFFLIFNF